MKKKIIVAGPKLHDIGYRVILIRKALEMGFENFYVYNAIMEGKQAVIILVEDSEELINDFVRFLKDLKLERAEIESLTQMKYEGKVPSIDRCIQAFQMDQWVKGIPILLNMSETLKRVDKNTSLLPNLSMTIEAALADPRDDKPKRVKQEE